MGELLKESGDILVVDDDALVLRTHRRMLENAGFTTQGAVDGEQALVEIGQHEFDAVLSDISMPGMTGIEMLKEVRRFNVDLPIVLVTGAPALETAVEAVEYGALKYLSKPVDYHELIATMTRAVRLYRFAQLKRKALDAAGKSGGNFPDRATVESTFARGMEGLFLAFQPIVRWPDRSVFAYEALLRTREPSIPHPLVFLELADVLDRRFELSREVRRCAAEQSAGLPDNALLFVNLQLQDLNDDELRSPDAPLTRIADRVVLEITERESLEKVRGTQERVQELKQLGFRIAIDDLGAGYSGLMHLARLEPTVAKLDMSLIRNIDRQPNKRIIVGSLVEACRALEMLVVAEGVETVHERDALEEIGCELMQGFFFARPENPFVTPNWDP